MEDFIPIIRRSIQTDTSVRMNYIRTLLQKSKFLSIDKQMKYVFQMLGYDSMWVSVKKEKVTDLIFPAIYVKYAENENEANNLVLVTRSENNSFLLHDSLKKYIGKKVDLNFFSNDNVTFFLFEKNTKLSSFAASEKQDNMAYGIVYFLWLVISFLILTFFIIEKKYLNASLGFIGLLGSYIFYMLLSHHFMKDKNFVSSICNMGSKSSCEKVFNYEIFKNKLFDFKVLGLIYFFSLSLSILASFGQAIFFSISFIGPIMLLGVLGSIYSFYLQAFKVRAFCKICLLSSFLILLSAFLFFSATNPEWTFSAFLQSFFNISVSSLLSILFYNQLESKAHQLSTEAYLTYFKSDTDILKHIISLEYENNIEEIFGGHQFEFGNPDANNVFGLIISLNCHHCYETLGQFVDMIDNSHHNKVKIWIASNESPTAKEVSFLNYLIETKNNCDITEFYKELRNWYMAVDKPFIASKNADDKFIKGVHRVPVVLLGNKVLPHFYNVSDLKHLLS